MSRIRSIHPGIFTDEAYMEASMAARLLLPGLWTEAWDDGVFEWKPLTLKARLFPVDNVNVADLLDELEGLKFLQRFEFRGKQYGAIRNFRRYQRPKKPNRSGVLPAEFETYVGASESSSEPDGIEDGGVPHQFGTGGEKSQQMEDGGWREEIDTSPPSDEAAPGSAEPGTKLNGAHQRRPRAKREPVTMPEDFALSEADCQFARRRGVTDPQIRTEFERFTNHHRARGNVFKDWSAAWRTWVLSPYRAKAPEAPDLKRFHMV